MVGAGLALASRNRLRASQRREVMPLITVTYSSSRTIPSLKGGNAAAVSELPAKILHKDPKVTAIIVRSVDAADWFAGGKSLAEQKLASYWLEIPTNEGTNTKNEKA